MQQIPQFNPGSRDGDGAERDGRSAQGTLSAPSLLARHRWTGTCAVLKTCAETICAAVNYRKSL